MVDQRTYEYRPDYAIPPGETLAETIASLDLSQVDLARRTGLSTKHINQVIKGLAPITPETAVALDRVTGVPATLWLNLESNYRTRLAVAVEADTLADARQWMRALPVRELARRGLIPDSSDRATLARQLLAFFGVASIPTWKQVWGEPTAYAHLRQSGGGDTRIGSLAAWLRAGELLSREVVTDGFDEGAFKSRFRDIRMATRQPGTAIQQVREICASAGLVLVVVPEFAGARVSGAARWLSPRRPLIQLSLRYGRDDSFWFSFFHEAAHLLLHPKRTLYVEDDILRSTDTPAEREQATDLEVEANQFASEALLPGVTASDLGKLRTLADVTEFASDHGVAPGIVVGRLHFLSLKPYSWGNRLRREVRIDRSS